ncbi:MAG: sterol desaturase family protein [Parvularculaceae bacterium]|nr:sterol desaturase family protein [Parvularculaceae bacterium]
MKIEMLVIAGVYAAFALAEVLFTGFLRKDGATRDDAKVEWGSTLALVGFVQPLTVFLGAGLAALVVPGQEDALATLPLWAGVALFLVFDDMTQYWWHRASHTFPWLYKLHRPHHNAQYMSVRIVYRNNVFYYMLMPGLWFSGVLLFLGLGWIYAGYAIVKMTVIIAAHCDVRWDRPLLRNRYLSPLMWVVERTISTPTTHAAHHGRYVSDEATNYKGNFGNLLFFWDVLFGTAKITRQLPQHFGVENLPDTTVGEQLLWPVVRKGRDGAASAPVTENG